MTRYNIKGISLDYCRWPTGLTSEALLTLHRELREKLGDKWDELEISARFPANDPVFFQGFEAWMRDDLVDLVIPANPFSAYPKINMSPYVELAHSCGKKVYADIHNFSKRNGNMISIIRPNEVKELASNYYQKGVDGLFFYQSEMIIEDLFLRRTIHELNENVDL